MQTLFRRALVVAVVVAFVGCEYEELGPNISRVNAIGIREVKIRPQIDTAILGDTITSNDQVELEALAIARTGAVISDMRFVWTSSNPAVATVDTVGVVTALAPGESLISASAGKIGRARLIVIRVTPTLPLLPPVTPAASLDQSR